MAQFLQALQKVLTHEGGYVNDPKDQNGETYKGIVRKMHDDWKGWSIIDSSKKKEGFPHILETEKELQTQVSLFYQLNFWNKLNADQINNQSIAESIFDFSVSADVVKSASLAQKVTGSAVDGIIGEHSLKNLNAFNPDHFLAAFAIEKIAYYIVFIKNEPAGRDHFVGWVCRAIGNRCYYGE